MEEAKVEAESSRTGKWGEAIRLKRSLGRISRTW